MFGFGLKAKTERVLSDIFFYSVAPSMRPVFNGLVSQGKSMGQNEFSIAFYYGMDAPQARPVFLSVDGSEFETNNPA